MCYGYIIVFLSLYLQTSWRTELWSMLPSSAIWLLPFSASKVPILEICQIYQDSSISPCLRHSTWDCRVCMTITANGSTWTTGLLARTTTIDSWIGGLCLANEVSGDQIESASTTWKVHSEAPTKIGGKDSFPRKRTQKINVLSRDHVNYWMTQPFNSEFF